MIRNISLMKKIMSFCNVVISCVDEENAEEQNQVMP
jgi:hypothetical protein